MGHAYERRHAAVNNDDRVYAQHADSESKDISRLQCVHIHLLSQHEALLRTVRLGDSEDTRGERSIEENAGGAQGEGNSLE